MFFCCNLCRDCKVQLQTMVQSYAKKPFLLDCDDALFHIKMYPERTDQLHFMCYLFLESCSRASIVLMKINAIIRDVTIVGMNDSVSEWDNLPHSLLSGESSKGIYRSRWRILLFTRNKNNSMESQWRQSEGLPSSPLMPSYLPESCLQILDIRQSPSNRVQFQVLVRDSTDDQATEYWMSSNALLEDPDLWDPAWYAFCAQITTKKAMAEHVNRNRSTRYQGDDGFNVEDMRDVRGSVKKQRRLEEGTPKQSVRKGIITSIEGTPSGQQVVRLTLQGRNKRQVSRQPSVSPNKKASISPAKSSKSPKRMSKSPSKSLSISTGSPPKTKPGAASSIEMARDILQKPKSRNCRIA